MTTATAIRLATRMPSQPVSPAPSLSRRMPASAPQPSDRAAPGGFDGLGIALDLAKGGIVFEEGEAAGSYYKVLTGAVRVYKLLPDGRRHIADFFVAGDVFGFTSRATYDFTAEAITDATLVGYRWRAHDPMDPGVGRRLLATVCAGLAAAQDQTLLLGRMSAAERLSSFLLRMAERTGHRDEKAPVIDLFMSRTDIADHLGLTTETVSRTFTELRRRKLIALEGTTHVVLLQLQALHAIGGGCRHGHA
jgi:CRP/FNR family transcriptional regulator, anaerobic regulatory protein